MSLCSQAVAGESIRRRVLVPIADGSEEIETTSIQDTLVRAGAEVTVASVMARAATENNRLCTMSRGLKVLADCSIQQCVDKDWDMVVCPGGMPGAEHLKSSPELSTILHAQHASNKPIAAVCASPAVVLAQQGLLHQKRATCYPVAKFQDKLPQLDHSDVVVDGNVCTSKGPGTSLHFALACVEILFGIDKAKEVANGMLLSYPPSRL